MEREKMLEEAKQVRESYRRDAAAIRAETERKKAQFRAEINGEREAHNALVKSGFTQAKESDAAQRDRGSEQNINAIEQSSLRLQSLFEQYDAIQELGLDEARGRFDQAMHDHDDVLGASR